MATKRDNKNSKKLKRCSRCALPETYPGVNFSMDGVCNYCLYYDCTREREKAVKELLRKKFSEIATKKKNQKNKYDCIVAFSGGKDSTFMLQYLKERFGFKILAHTFDNGFISQEAYKNIDRVVGKLGVDHEFTKPKSSILREVFSSAINGELPYPKEILAMLSPVCAACLGMVFGTTLHLAMDMKIPLMFVGFTPGQYPGISLENFLKVKSCVFLSENIYRDDPVDIIKILRDPVEEKFGKKVEKYFFKSQYLEKGKRVPHVLFPFHALMDYDEKEILKKIKNVGWVKPRDTGTCSTNCLLNVAGIHSVLKQFGYHPYIGELSLLVRMGKISYEEAIKAEAIDVNSEGFKLCMKTLKIRGAHDA